MDCEQSLMLLVAEMDREIQAEDRALLAQHVAACADCRAAAEAFRLQDADLRRAFVPRRKAVESLTERIIALLPPPSNRVRSRIRGWPLLAAAAAGFLFAVLLFRPWERASQIVQNSNRTPPGDAEKETVLLAVSNGAVEFLAPGSNLWQALKTGKDVAVGSRVRTGPAVRCEFRTADGSEVRLNTGTEVLFTAGRLLELTQGQILASVAEAPTPFKIGVPGATVTAVGTEFDLLSRAAESVLTVLQGTTKVEGKGDQVIVEKGERAKIVDGKVTEKDQAEDLLQATRWVHEILILKGRDNKELARRIDDLLAQIGESKTSFLNEQEIRALGDHCVLPLTRFLQSERYQAALNKRHLAANILADLAQPWSIPDLIKLLRDKDGLVRYHAARGLERLTRETFKRTPAQWRDQPLPVLEGSYKQWQQWWQDHQHLYPAAP
jgi:ferric-dicitrate binding protein FerR (iron transport regulator)